MAMAKNNQNTTDLKVLLHVYVYVMFLLQMRNYTIKNENI